MFQGNEIWHGDSRKLASKVPNDINAIITDPPYGMDFKSNNTKTAKNDKHAQKIAGDGDMDEAIALFNEVVVETLVPKCTDEAEMYVFTAWHILDVWIPLVKAIPEFELKMMLIWQKGYPGLGDLEGNWGCGYEPILYLKKGRRPLPYRRQGILAFDKIASGQNFHPMEKPVPLLEQLIEMSTDPGDFVVDPFAGSGSTIKAAQNLDRNALGIERDQEFHRGASERLTVMGFEF